MIPAFNSFFNGSYAQIHSGGEHTKYDGARHHDIHLEYLTAVYYHVSQSGGGNEVFSHDRADPCKPYVDLEHIHKRRYVGGEYELGKYLKLRCAHRFQQKYFALVNAHKPVEHAYNGDYDANEYRHHDYGLYTRADPDDYYRTERNLGQRVEHDYIRFEYVPQPCETPKQYGYYYAESARGDKADYALGERESDMLEYFRRRDLAHRFDYARRGGRDKRVHPPYGCYKFPKPYYSRKKSYAPKYYRNFIISSFCEIQFARCFGVPNFRWKRRAFPVVFHMITSLT